VILATTDDLTNLDAGLVSRDLNPDARVVMRLFDESLARKVEGAFHIPVISTAQVSAPTYVAAATGRKVYQELRLGGQHVYLADLTIREAGKLVGHSVGQIQKEEHVNIVMHRGPGGVNVNPGHEIVFRPGDEILVIAPIAALLELEEANGARGC
jgi:Trk K+ transport system NAD-binding subunit